MASQELYSTVSTQLEDAQCRLKESIEALDWERTACEAAVVSELARVLVAMMPELETD